MHRAVARPTLPRGLLPMNPTCSYNSTGELIDCPRMHAANLALECLQICLGAAKRLGRRRHSDGMTSKSWSPHLLLTGSVSWLTGGRYLRGQGTTGWICPCSALSRLFQPRHLASRPMLPRGLRQQPDAASLLEPSFSGIPVATEMLDAASSLNAVRIERKLLQHRNHTAVEPHCCSSLGSGPVTCVCAKPTQSAAKFGLQGLCFHQISMSACFRLCVRMCARMCLANVAVAVAPRTCNVHERQKA